MTTRSGCTITIDDDAGSILITDPSGSKVLLGGDKTITIDSEEKITLHSKVIEIHADEKVDTKGDKEVIVKATRPQWMEPLKHLLQAKPNSHRKHLQ